jgi:hypothetical protein
MKCAPIKSEVPIGADSQANSDLSVFLRVKVAALVEASPPLLGAGVSATVRSSSKAKEGRRAAR